MFHEDLVKERIGCVQVYAEQGFHKQVNIIVLRTKKQIDVIVIADVLDITLLTGIFERGYSQPCGHGVVAKSIVSLQLLMIILLLQIFEFN